MERRDILAANPVSFNELLDVFESFLGSIEAPLRAANELIKDQFNYFHGDIFGHTVGSITAADDMSNQLKRIRAARNASADITITLSEDQARRAEVATSEVEPLFSQAAAVFELLHTGLTSGSIDPEGSGLVAVLEQGRRAMISAADQEGAMVTQLAECIRKAKTYQQPTEEELA